MNTLPTNGRTPASDRRDSRDSGEDTLRLIASLPVPQGLAERVKEGMQSAPESGRILRWRGALRPAGGWMYTNVARGAAAAAIVCVVAGGGWRIYSRVQPGSSGNFVVMPAPTAPSGGGFGIVKATRVPDRLDPPVLIHPAAPAPEANPENNPKLEPAQKAPVQPRAVRHEKKAPSRPAATSVQ